MINKDLINKFGYSEMYEWSELFKFDINPYGRFVTFSNNETGKIKLAEPGDFIIGVTTINSVCTSDDPNEWQGKYLSSDVGDRIFHRVSNEMIPMINPDYNSSINYMKRSERKEWIRINLLGKCIVVDNGKCNKNSLCTIGKNGIAVPSRKNNKNTYYVIDRLSDNTIMIFFK